MFQLRWLLRSILFYLSNRFFVSLSTANYQQLVVLMDDREGLATHRSRSRFRPNERESLFLALESRNISLSFLVVHHIAHHLLAFKTSFEAAAVEVAATTTSTTTSGRDGSLFTVHSFLIARSSGIFHASLSNTNKLFRAIHPRLPSK